MFNKLQINEFTKWLSIIILTLMMLVIGYARLKLKQEDKKDEMNFHLNNTKDRIEESLKNSYNICLNLAFCVSDDGKVKNFEKVASDLYKQNKNIDGLQLVPNGIIEFVYPFEENKAVIGYNILENTPNKIVSLEANKTKLEKKIYFSGPFELKQGGFGFVGRIPVYIEGKFWGFSAVIVKLDNFFDHVGISKWQLENYGIQFSKVDPITKKEIFFVKNQPQLSNRNFLSTTISNEGWKIYIFEKQKNSWFYLVWFDWSVLILFYFAILMSIQTLYKRSKLLIRQVEVQGEQLLENSKIFHAIFNELSIGIVKINAETNKIDQCNDFFCELLQYKQDELNNLCTQDITYFEDKNITDQLIQDIKEKKISFFNSQKRYVTNSGNPIWCNITVSGITNNKNNLVYFLSIVENIQDKKEIEQANILHQQRMESLFNDSPIPIWEEDFSEIKNYLQTIQFPDVSTIGLRNYLLNNKNIVQNCISLLKIVEVNHACVKLHEAKSKEHLMENINKIFPESAFETFVYQLISIIQNKTSFKTETFTQTIDGKIRNINFQWNVMKGFENNYQRVIITTEDITEKIKNEEQYREAQEKINNLVSTVEGVVWEGNTNNYEPEYISDKAESFFGYPKEVWSNQVNFRESIIQEDASKIINEYLNKVKSQQKFDLEYAILHQNGNKIWIRDCINVINLPNGETSVRGIMMDISNLKKIQHQLTNSLEVLTEQNKKLLNFSHIVSHNLRSHSSNILSLSNLIEETEDVNEKLEYAQILCEVGKQLDATMINLTQLTEKNVNNESEKKLLNVDKYINQILISLQLEIRDSGLFVHKDYELNLEIFANPVFFESILHNIISNAIKFRNPKASSYLKIKGFENENFTVLEFSDNGLGMNIKGKEEKVFQLYKMFHKNISTKGLGLFMTKNQVEAMGGTIEVESKEMVGTTFIVKIPKV